MQKYSSGSSTLGRHQGEALSNYVPPPLQRRYMLQRGIMGFKNFICDADTFEHLITVEEVHLSAEPLAERIVAALNLQIGKVIEDPFPMNDVIVVSRPSVWGNPYVLGRGCQRCLQIHTEPGSTIPCFILYAEARLKVEPDWLRPLFGKKLHCAGCSIGAFTCHARVLERLRQ